MVDKNPIRVRYNPSFGHGMERGRRLHAAAEAVIACQGGVAATSPRPVLRAALGRPSAYGVLIIRQSLRNPRGDLLDAQGRSLGGPRDTDEAGEQRS